MSTNPNTEQEAGTKQPLQFNLQFMAAIFFFLAAIFAAVRATTLEHPIKEAMEMKWKVEQMIVQIEHLKERVEELEREKKK